MQGELINVNIKEVFIDEAFNCRGKILPVDVIDLSKDIEKQGLIQPVVIAPFNKNNSEGVYFKYRLIAGYRRCMACSILGWTEVPAVLRRDIQNELDAQLLNISENLQRKDLSIEQESNAVRNLVERGLTRAEISQKLNRSSFWVQTRDEYTRLPKEIQEDVNAGFLKISQVRHLFMIYKRSGKERTFLAAKKMKKAKSENKKIDFNPNRLSKKKKMHRTPAEINQLLEHILKFLPAGLYTRTMAWCAGNITMEELNLDLKEFAKKIDCNYFPPQNQLDVEDIVKDENE